MLVTVEGTDTASVVSALTRQVQTLPDELMASLTVKFVCEAISRPGADRVRPG